MGPWAHVEWSAATFVAKMMTWNLEPNFGAFRSHGGTPSSHPFLSFVQWDFPSETNKPVKPETSVFWMNTDDLLPLLRPCHRERKTAAETGSCTIEKRYSWSNRRCNEGIKHMLFLMRFGF